MKLLVVEHEAIVAQALKLLLASMACEVAMAQGDAALNLLVQEVFDLIILDGAASPDLGAELHARQPQTPILLLGAGPEVPPWAAETLVKPVDAVDLVTRISRCD